MQTPATWHAISLPCKQTQTSRIHHYSPSHNPNLAMTWHPRQHPRMQTRAGPTHFAPLHKHANVSGEVIPLHHHLPTKTTHAISYPNAKRHEPPPPSHQPHTQIERRTAGGVVQPPPTDKISFIYLNTYCF